MQDAIVVYLGYSFLFFRTFGFFVFYNPRDKRGDFYKKGLISDGILVSIIFDRIKREFGLIPKLFPQL